MFDQATQATACGFVILLLTALFLKFFNVSRRSEFEVFFVVSTFVWFVLTVLGEFITGWATNNFCYTYLGCNDGFFGYDAIEHFLFGFSLLMLLLFVADRYPSLSLKWKSSIKSILTLLAFVALTAAIWEMFECGWDQYRVVILHETLFSFKLHIDALSQSSNLDTMGDISFTLLGALVGCGISEFLQPGILKSHEAR